MSTQVEIGLFQCKELEPDALSYTEFRLDISGNKEDRDGLLIRRFLIGVESEEERELSSDVFNEESAKHLRDFLNYALKDL